MIEKAAPPLRRGGNHFAVVAAQRSTEAQRDPIVSRFSAVAYPPSGPFSGRSSGYCRFTNNNADGEALPDTDLREMLARNLRALVKHNADRGGLYTSSRTIGKKAGVGKSTVARIMQPTPDESLPAVDTLDAVARVFKLRAWQLLIDGLDPANPPACMTPDIAKELAELRALRAMLDQWEDEHAADTPSRAPQSVGNGTKDNRENSRRVARKRPKAPRP
jgi:hypothetical protein